MSVSTICDEYCGFKEALTQHKNKDIRTLKLQRQHVSQALLLKMALWLDFKFAERLYLSNDSR